MIPYLRHCPVSPPPGNGTIATLPAAAAESAGALPGCLPDIIPGGDPMPEAARRIQPALDYMRQNLHRPLRVSTLSKLAGLSPSRFFELFRLATGSSPMRFFTRLRIDYSSSLLASTGLLVKNVADAVGYEDPYHFSRVFKSFNGVAPTEYRWSARNSGRRLIAGR